VNLGYGIARDIEEPALFCDEVVGLKYFVLKKTDRAGNYAVSSVQRYLNEVLWDMLVPKEPFCCRSYLFVRNIFILDTNPASSLHAIARGLLKVIFMSLSNFHLLKRESYLVLATL
jgi:hypothetical protein